MAIYLWGGCELDDCAKRLRSQDPKNKYWYLGGTSCGSLFSDPGEIAQKVYSWYNKLKETDRRYESILQFNDLYKEIVSKDYFTEQLPHITKKDWLVISFTKEIYPRCNYKSEHITIGQNILEGAKKAIDTGLDSAVYETLANKQYAVGFDDELVIHNYKNNWGPKLADYFAGVFADRVLLVHVEPARRRFNKRFGLYWSLPTSASFSSVYAAANNGKYHDKTNWYEVNKAIRFLHTGFRMRYPYKIPQVTIGHKDTVADDHHSLGPNPFHFDSKTIKHISNVIKSRIDLIPKESVVN